MKVEKRPATAREVKESEVFVEKRLPKVKAKVVHLLNMPDNYFLYLLCDFLMDRNKQPTREIFKLCMLNHQIMNQICFDFKAESFSDLTLRYNNKMHVDAFLKFVSKETLDLEKYQGQPIQTNIVKQMHQQNKALTSEHQQYPNAIEQQLNRLINAK